VVSAVAAGMGAEFDYIIVGAGSAGCVLANRLSEDPSVRVCLVEAGPSDRRPLTRFKVNLPAGNTLLLSSPTYNWGYVYEGAEGLHHAAIASPRGKLGGGSSAVNGMVYMRGHRLDYDHWAALGNPGWGYKDILPYFKKHEHRESGADEFHGTGGELNVAKLRWLNPLSQAFIAAAGETQYPSNEDFNGAVQDGFGAHEVTQKNGQRWSAARAFLHPVLHRPNLAVLHDALTLRVRFEGKRAVGVNLRVAGAARELAARREIILSAGAFNSPQILMLSGVGPGSALAPHGIPVVHDLPGVGRNLHDHAAAWVQREDRSARSFALSARALPWLARALLSYTMLRRGPLTSNLVEAGGFIRSRPDLEAPDIQFTFMPAIKDFSRWISRTHAFGISACLLQPKSRGYIELKSADPAAPPILHPRFLDHEDDVARLVHGLRVARQILSAPAFAAAGGAEIRPGPDVTTAAQIENYLRRNLTTIFHPVGTCKMGPREDPASVVDGRLRLHGVAGVRVIDASIMPRVTSGNTNAPTMMIAERGAEFIRQDAR
jgi:choline dehydrogenase